MVDVLGESHGRFRTVAPFGLVVPHEPGCANQAYGLLHRMATLVPDLGPLHAEGDLYVIDAGGLRAIDRLESYDGDQGRGVRAADGSASSPSTAARR